MILDPTKGLFSVRMANLSKEAARLDAFILEHPQSTPFHLTAWARAIKKGCGHETHYLLAEDGGDQLVALLPLTEIRSRLFGNALVSSGFAVGGGLISDNAAASQALVDHATALARSSGCPTIELRGGQQPAGWHVDDSSYLGFKRGLAGDDELELLTIPRKQRAEVRKALGSNLDVEIGRSKRDLDAHFSCYSESVRNLGTPVFPRKLFASVLEEMGEDADIITIRHEGHPVSSVLNLYHKGVVMPYWGGGVHAARALRANELVYYALMCHARKQKGCNQFDFGRSKVGTGPAAFKKGWGFEPMPLSYAKWQADGSAQRDINPQSAKYQAKIAMWKKLPLPIANMLGPILSKGLG